MRTALGASPGERILDVGCGPGFYCLELLEDVGASGSVVGVDGSASMLALARRRCSGHDNVELREAGAVSLPVEDASFDAVLSVQVQEYVPDVSASLGEAHRALRPGGRVLVWDIDWTTLSLHSDDPALTERVLRAWDEHLAHPALPRRLRPLLEAAGFDDVRMQAHPLATVGFNPGSYANAIVPFIGDFVAGRAGVGEDEARSWVAAQRELAERGEFYFACTQLCFTARKPG